MGKSKLRPLMKPLLFPFALLLAACPMVPAKAETAPRRIVCCGDSITAGLGLSPEKAWPIRLQDRFEESGLAVRIINTAGPGETVASVQMRLKRILMPPPDWVVLALGREEGQRQTDLESFSRNLGNLIDSIRETSAQTQIVLAGQQVVKNSTLTYHQRFFSLFAALAQEKKVVLVPDFSPTFKGLFALCKRIESIRLPKDKRSLPRTFGVYLILF